MIKYHTIQQLKEQNYKTNLNKGGVLTREECDEVVSESLETANEKYDPSKGSFDAFLGTIVSNKRKTATCAKCRATAGTSRNTPKIDSLDRCSIAGRSAYESIESDGSYNADHLFTLADEESAAEEAEMRIHAAISQLTPMQQRTAYSLILKIPAEQMARREGVSLKTINKRVFDTRQALIALGITPHGVRQAC